MSRNNTVNNFVFAWLSFISGLIVGWVDFINNEPQPAVALLLLFTVLLGALKPRLAWLWALLCTAGLPLAYLLLSGLGLKPASWPAPGLYATLLAVIPAMLGALGGVLINYLIRGLRRKD